ncbi:hypothetical protein INT47_012255 [Mucor saturninus]|uniref:Uncharacterized protein n=1 Tax=Mucor saturninus TaxID=64648 RepID=A0A8H7V6E1_9FUNG|nr:hypothetical protein INT47_012255 [Mucor saturninus]
MNELVTAIVTFTELLQQAKSPCVATWRPFFITTCSDWCIYIETELAVQTEEESVHLCQQAQSKSKLPIPPLSILLDALHVFFHTLLENIYTSNNLYLHIMKNYRFLTIPEKDILTQDLSQLASEAATQNILLDMLDELK